MLHKYENYAPGPGAGPFYVCGWRETTLPSDNRARKYSTAAYISKMNGPAGSIVHRNGVRVLATPPAASTGAPPGARFCAPPRVAHHGSAICPDVLRVSDEQEPVRCQLGRVDDDPVFVQWPQWFLNAANDLCFVTSCNISKRVLETRHVCFEWQVQFLTENPTIIVFSFITSPDYTGGTLSTAAVAWTEVTTSGPPTAVHNNLCVLNRVQASSWCALSLQPEFSFLLTWGTLAQLRQGEVVERTEANARHTRRFARTR